MINVPSKLFERNIDDVEIGMSEIHLYSKKEIEEGQLGYRIDSDGKEIKEWIGNNYIVIGNDSALGDPIIADIVNESLPVFNMFHDDWSSLELIADSFEQYIMILKDIQNKDIENKQECIELLEFIEKEIPQSYDYWEGLIKSAYEFLTDKEY